MENQEELTLLETEKTQEQQSFSEPDFWTKLGAFAKKAGVKICYVVLLLYYMMRSPSTSPKDRALIIGALAYFISPLDGIPDGIPSLGFADDWVVLLFAFRAVLNNITPEVMQQAREKLGEFFKNIDETQLNQLI